MSRVPPAPPAQYEPLFGPAAPLRQRVYAQAPALAGSYLEFMRALRRHGTLPHRLLELVRLRVAFHNQCRTCMSIRYGYGGDAAVSESLVCSLEKPQESPDLSAAEKAAIDFADRFATDHLSIDDSTFARLQAHFTPAEVMELCFQVATFVGYGRMGAVLAITDDLPEEYRDPDTVVAPWRQAPHEFA